MKMIINPLQSLSLLLKLSFTFILISFFACSPRKSEIDHKTNSSLDTLIRKTTLDSLFRKANSGLDTLIRKSTLDSLYKNAIKIVTTDKNTKILETFADSFNIGEKGKSKIELIKHTVFDSQYIIIKFYTKENNNWYTRNNYYYESDALIKFCPQITDYNNDGYNDISFISGTAARGSNEVRRLFIYDGNDEYDKKLISIVNSEDYPNILYNRELDCIDSQGYHGGSTTCFTRIKGDSLKVFAFVDIGEFRTVYEIDKFGKKRLLRKDAISSDEIYTRYINYKPLKPYTKKDSDENYVR